MAFNNGKYRNMTFVSQIMLSWDRNNKIPTVKLSVRFFTHLKGSDPELCYRIMYV
jgi:hypothetical protein